MSWTFRTVTTRSRSYEIDVVSEPRPKSRRVYEQPRIHVDDDDSDEQPCGPPYGESDDDDDDNDGDNEVTCGPGPHNEDDNDEVAIGR
jgi:hypothetical protein